MRNSISLQVRYVDLLKWKTPRQSLTYLDPEGEMVADISK